MVIHQAEIEAVRRQASQEQASRIAQEREESRRKRQEFVKYAIEQAEQAPERIDYGLKVIAGEGNDILHWFLRIVACSVPVIVLLALLWAFLAVIFG